MGPTLTRTVSWDSEGRIFSLTLADERVTLQQDGQQLACLTLAEWEGVRAGLSALARFRQGGTAKPRADRSTPEAPSNGRPWTEELDAELCRGWYAGEGLAALATRLGRTEGSIASRLARLDIVADRDEARQRP